MSESVKSYEALVELVGQLRDRICWLEGRVVELQAQNGKLQGDNECLQGDNERLRSENKQLRERLGSDSSNSSLPPSSDGLGKSRSDRSLRSKSGFTPGGQPGRKGSFLKQVADPDVRVVLAPQSCCGCGRGLSNSKVVGSEIRQVFDLPPVKVCVTEYERQVLVCGSCGVKTEGSEFPLGVCCYAQYGPLLRAFAVYLTNYHHVPYKRCAQLLTDIAGVQISPGTVVNTVGETAGKLADFDAAIREAIVAQPVVCFDETGARAAGKTVWCHSASTSELSSYTFHNRRGKQATDDIGILPSFEGVAVHDGWASYRSYEDCEHALCNAHHLRELKQVVDNHPDQDWPHMMTRLLLDLKDAVDQAKEKGKDKLSRATITKYRDRYETVIDLAHQENPPPPSDSETRKRKRPKKTKTQNLIGRLDDHREEVLKFATNLYVCFDNNQAERDIRMIKTQQKISGCFRTLKGATNYAITRSYIQTAIKQKQHILTTIQQAIQNTPWQPTTTSDQP